MTMWSHVLISHSVVLEISSYHIADNAATARHAFRRHSRSRSGGYLHQPHVAEGDPTPPRGTAPTAGRAFRRHSRSRSGGYLHQPHVAEGDPAHAGVLQSDD